MPSDAQFDATHPLPSSGITIRHLAQLDVPEATFSPYAPAHTPFCVFDTPTITLRSASRTRCALPPPVDSSRRANATGRLDAPLSATYTRTSSAISDIAGIAVQRASLTRCAFRPPEESANSPPRMSICGPPSTPHLLGGPCADLLENSGNFVVKYARRTFRFTCQRLARHTPSLMHHRHPDLPQLALRERLHLRRHPRLRQPLSPRAPFATRGSFKIADGHRRVQRFPLGNTTMLVIPSMFLHDVYCGRLRVQSTHTSRVPCSRTELLILRDSALSKNVGYESLDLAYPSPAHNEDLGLCSVSRAGLVGVGLALVGGRSSQGQRAWRAPPIFVGGWWTLTLTSSWPRLLPRVLRVARVLRGEAGSSGMLGDAAMAQSSRMSALCVGTLVVERERERGVGQDTRDSVSTHSYEMSSRGIA
ncbi:hypothetical protein B0H10DRAFT_2231970 [Mycena sp. CBHHK59/15]|nr:hypothetical protein B0H10DRAFT_2231970 [Mycena sp. CBHHK59/15]